MISRYLAGNISGRSPHSLANTVHVLANAVHISQQKQLWQELTFPSRQHGHVLDMQDFYMLGPDRRRMYVYAGVDL